MRDSILSLGIVQEDHRQPGGDPANQARMSISDPGAKLGAACCSVVSGAAGLYYGIELGGLAAGLLSGGLAATAGVAFGIPIGRGATTCWTVVTSCAALLRHPTRSERQHATSSDFCRMPGITEADGQGRSAATDGAGSQG